jgi:Bacterial DNA-binding protein
MVKRMKKDHLAKRLAKQSGISTAAAADQLDEVLSSILRRLRQGHSASLPGLGTFLPGPRPEFYFEQCLPPGARRAPKGKKSRKSHK